MTEPLSASRLDEIRHHIENDHASSPKVWAARARELVAEIDRLALLRAHDIAWSQPPDNLGDATKNHNAAAMPMTPERLEELRAYHKLRDGLTHDEVNELFAEIDRRGAALEKARADALEEAAKVVDQNGPLADCPYGRDKPGDPTWDHTEDDKCPVCGLNANDSWRGCTNYKTNRIAKSIRSLKDQTP